MTDLKPCPFCGGKATLLMRTYTFPSATHVVYCEYCYAQGPERITESEAIEKWNRRMPERQKALRCRDCKHFAIKDYWADWNGTPILGASDAPVCMKWGEDGCLTKEDGYCFLAERKERDNDSANPNETVPEDWRLHDD